MSGRHKWSELVKKTFTPEERRLIEMEKAELRREMERSVHIPPITLDWSQWHSWAEIDADAWQSGVSAPNKEPGVYEVRFQERQERLAIGRSNNLYMQIKQGLVRGKAPHSTGKRIRLDMKAGAISASDISIRWAVTDRPAAVAEELHKRHKGRFGGLPKYNKHG